MNYDIIQQDGDVMNGKKKLIWASMIFMIIGVLFPILFLLRIIEDDLAFPVIFTCLGVNQIFIGIFIITENKRMRIANILLGSLFLLFALGVVIPHYYF